MAESHHHLHHHNHQVVSDEAAISSVAQSASQFPSSYQTTTSSSSMAMTFSPWSQYQVSILFSSWTTSTVGEFVLAWFLVVLAAIAYHALRYVLAYTEDILKSNVKKHRFPFDDWMGMDESTPPTTNDSALDSNSDDKRKRLQLTVRDRLRWRIFHALLSSCVYAWALLLMLIAMSYNSALFLALIVGYGIGNFIFLEGQEDMCH
jgi:hypothetical protein